MPDVLAYIDPGSGSLIFQAVVAAVLAVPFFFRAQIAKVGRALRRSSNDAPAADGSQEQPR